MSDYEQIGEGYSTSRRPDRRISEALVEQLDLPQGSRIADIGAGTGNYSKSLGEWGYRMVAIEPSSVMRSQLEPTEGIEWIRSRAESIPLPDDSVDGAMVILAFHHFPAPERAVSEILRIVGNGPIIIFTFSPEKLADFWLCDYFSAIRRDAEAGFPKISKLVERLGKWTDRKVEVNPFPLPKDLCDRFAASGWATPEIYLDEKVRNGISSFSKLSKDELDLGLTRLREDLDSGDWNSRYGSIKRRSEFDVGYSFVTLLPG